VNRDHSSDEDISPLHTMQGPITRALTLGSMHVLLIRNNGEDQ
jgi:hypothetical protein